MDFLALKEKINLDLILSSKILWLGFGVIMLIFGIFTVILFYHWINFSYGPKKVNLMSRIYLIISFILLGIILFGILTYSISR